MVDTLDGLESPLFNQFVEAFTHGFIELQANVDNLVSTLRVLANNSPFPCFKGKDATMIIEKMRQRLKPDLPIQQTVQHCMNLIIESYAHIGTRQYDSFQWYTNGIYI